MAVSLPHALAQVAFEAIDNETSNFKFSDLSYSLVIEDLARSYLRGRHLLIHTAALRGPFESSGCSISSRNTSSLQIRSTVAETPTRHSHHSNSTSPPQRDTLRFGTRQNYNRHCNGHPVLNTTRRSEPKSLPRFKGLPVTQRLGCSSRAHPRANTPQKATNSGSTNANQKRIGSGIQRAHKRKMMFDTPSTSHHSGTSLYLNNYTRSENGLGPMSIHKSGTVDGVMSRLRSVRSTKRNMARSQKQQLCLDPHPPHGEKNVPATRPDRPLVGVSHLYKKTSASLDDQSSDIGTQLALTRAHASFQDYLEPNPLGTTERDTFDDGHFEDPSANRLATTQLNSSRQKFGTTETSLKKLNTQDLYDAAPRFSQQSQGNTAPHRDPYLGGSYHSQQHPSQVGSCPSLMRPRFTGASSHDQVFDSISNSSQIRLDTHAMDSVLHNADSFLGSWNKDLVLTSTSQSTFVA